ncbi:cadherin repeat domain-containing protein, partial [Gammaproteobacteria bacterium]|nr:cadherin repeat domain-containing protein [Gammaproteobacteria bacterium]
DYETKSSYTATVTVSDGANSVNQEITVNVTDVNENIAPSISGLASSISAAENQTSVVSVSASDADGDSLSYSLSGTDSTSLSINSSGVIIFNSAPDYEVKNSYAITVSVSDGTDTTSQSITINVTNVDEDPVMTGWPAEISIAENTTALFSFTFIDPEGETFSIQEQQRGNNVTENETCGNIRGSTFISTNWNSSTGEGVVSFDSAPNYEDRSSYTNDTSYGYGISAYCLTIENSDTGYFFYTKILITDVAE